MRYSIVMKRPEAPTWPAKPVARVSTVRRAYLIDEEPTRIMSRAELDAALALDRRLARGEKR